MTKHTSSTMHKGEAPMSSTRDALALTRGPNSLTGPALHEGDKTGYKQNAGTGNGSVSQGTTDGPISADIEGTSFVT